MNYEQFSYKTNTDGIELEEYIASQIKAIVDKLVEHYNLTLNGDIAVERCVKQYSVDPYYNVSVHFETQDTLFVHRLKEGDEGYDDNYPNEYVPNDENIAKLKEFLNLAVNKATFYECKVTDTADDFLSFDLYLDFQRHFVISKDAKII